MKLHAIKSKVYGSLASLHVSLRMSECIQTPCIKSQTYKAIYLSSWFCIWNIFVTYCVCQDCICMETLHLTKVKTASVNAVQILQCPQNMPTNYIRWFVYKLPSLHSVSCSKDIRKLNSRGHIFQLLLTRAPFKCLQHFRINNLAFPFTCSQVTLTWLLRYLIMPANQGLRCPTNSWGAEQCPRGSCASPVQVQKSWVSTDGLAASPSSTARSSNCGQVDGQREELSCGWKEFLKSQPELALGASAACPTPQLLLSPFEKPQFPSV